MSREQFQEDLAEFRRDETDVVVLMPMILAHDMNVHETFEPPRFVGRRLITYTGRTLTE
jgi:hypothetical protein